MMKGLYYLVILVILLLDITKGSFLGKGHFRQGKLWGKKQNIKSKAASNWLEQKLDHFDSNEHRTWKQQYFVSEEHVNDKRDVAFLYISGEGPAGGLTPGAWSYFGQKPGAILFELEHRYYGDSHPTENLSLENLKYLSSRQALADLAVFIESANKKYKLADNVKWIVFGGSYAGSLAAWARQLYPDLVHGAVSSSGPLLAKVDFFEYLQVVEEALRTHSESCLKAVQDAIKQLEDLIRDAENRHKINTLFGLCENIEDSINNPLDIATLFQIVSDSFSGAVQYNNPYSYEGINFVCSKLQNESYGSELDRLAEVVTYINRLSECITINYQNYIEECTLESWASSFDGARQWFYQTCTEFGFYQTSTAEPYTFGKRLDVDYELQLCKQAYSPTFDKAFVEDAIAKTNDFYHGLDINVTNTVFVHGSLDPWHILGVYKTRSEDAPAILLEGASHCSDMEEPNTFDSEQLQKAHAQIEELITRWLNN